MNQKLIRATELAEFVYCSKAWHLKYLDGVEVSPGARELQAKANAWHIEQGRSLARRDLGDHPKPAIGYHFKTGHREMA
jgi:hypothetical protein